MRRLLALMVLAALPLAAVVGCSHGKAPTASAAPSASETAAAPRAPAASAAPAAAVAPSATSPGGAAAGTATAASTPAASGSGAPARADLVLLAGAAFDACKAPTAPPDPPDGHVATRAQMLSSHKLTADFNAATNQYLSCLAQASNTFDRQYGRILPISAVRDIVNMHDRFHNKAVDADQAVAKKFNDQLRIYKARGGAG